MRKPIGQTLSVGRAQRGPRSPLRLEADPNGNSTTQRPPAAKRQTDTPTTLLIIFLACLATVLCYQVFLKKYDSGLRGTVSKHFRELFPDARIVVGSVSSNGPNEIVLSDVRFFPRSAPDHEVFSIHRAIVKGNLDIAAWAKRTTSVTEVHLHGAQLNMWPTGQGRWSVDSLVPHSMPDKRPPAIVIHDANLQIKRAVDSSSLPIVVHDIQGAVRPPTSKTSTATIVQLQGRSSGIADRVEVAGSLDRTTGAWQGEGFVSRLRFSAEILARLPDEVSRYATQLAGLNCTLSGKFQGGAKHGAAPEFSMRGEILEGRLQDDRLPYPLDGLHGTYYCSNKVLQLRDLHASSGKTRLVVETDISGFTPQSPITITAEAVSLELDSRLYGSLPEKLQTQWDKLGLAGNVSGSFQLYYDGKTWTPAANLQCAGASIKPWLFPFALSNIYGPVTFRDNTFSSVGLKGMAGGQPLSASFSLTKSDSEWIGRMDGRSAGAISIDEQLLSALTPAESSDTSPAEKFVRSLSPSGSIELRSFSLERSTVEQEKWHRELDAYIYDARITYKEFRYPIYEIRGRLHCSGPSWSLDKFEGRNDSGRIACSGNWQQVESGEIPFRLDFDALDIPLEEELLGALPTDAQHIWRELQPDGSLDRVQVQLFREPNSQLTQTAVHITEDAKSNAVSGRSLRIYPRSFPYGLTDVECRIKYTPGRVEIYKASGKNRASEIALLGRCLPLSDGRWQAGVQWLPQTRLIVDQELLGALPQSIRESLVKIDFRGPISVIGTSEIAFPNSDFPDPVTHWNCQLDVEDAQLGAGDTIDNMRGTVYTNGWSDGKHVRGSGRLAMDALTVLDVPVFGLEGPFELFDSTLYFGEAVNEALPPVDAQTDTRMHAKALAGDFFISGTGQLTTGKFEFASQLQNAELSSLLQDVGVDRASTKAQCNASAFFSGVPWNSQGWSGDGQIHLSDAQLFQLPFMIRLMRVASVNARDDSAFQRADINFRIDGDQIPLTIDCSGDLLRLRGEGYTNLRRDINLELFAYVGRRISLASIVSPILPESRFATTLMAIKVDGTLDDPQMARRPFPQFASMQELFPELEQ